MTTLAADLRAYAQGLLSRIWTFRSQSPPPSVEETQEVVMALYGLEDYARNLRKLLDPEGAAIEGHIHQSLTGSVTIEAVLPAGQEPPGTDSAN